MSLSRLAMPLDLDNLKAEIVKLRRTERTA